MLIKTPVDKISGGRQVDGIKQPKLRRIFDSGRTGLSSRLQNCSSLAKTRLLEAMARFSLATGLRESNVTGLLWEQLDMQRQCAWVHADQAKAKKAIAVPLNNAAINIVREQIGKNNTHVFTYKGKPVSRANNHAWQKALVRADIKDFRWHDLRHTWASWHIQNGTPIHVLQELGGWADLSMVLRYAHLSGEHLREYVNNAKSETNLLHCDFEQKKRS